LSRRGFFLFSTNSLIWGVPFWLSKILLTQFTPETTVFLRSCIGAIFAFCLALTLGEMKVPLRHLHWLFLFALVQMIIPWWLTAHAQRHLPSSVVGLMMTLIPIFSLTFAFFESEESAITGRRAFGVGIGILGVVLLVGIDSNSRSISLFSILLLVISTLGYAYAPRVLNSHLKQVSSTSAVTFILLFSSLAWAVPGILTWPHERIRPTVILATLTLGLVCTGLAFWIFFELVKEIGPSKTSFLAFTNPLVAVVVGVRLAHEPMTTGLLVGLPLIMIGTYLSISTGYLAVDNRKLKEG
jgi:drug/metabolite transporter (DMT)-like permease